MIKTIKTIGLIVFISGLLYAFLYDQFLLGLSLCAIMIAYQLYKTTS